MSDRGGPTSAEPSGLDGLPPLYNIYKGEVVSVQTYGAFVRLPGYKKQAVSKEMTEVWQKKVQHQHELSLQGLVHVSEMSASRVENPSEIVDVGEQVWIKVIGREIQGEKVKLSFSMKAVNQGTGRDLDPNNVSADQDARRRKQFKDHTGNKITLEAVLNTTCSKCGCKGHFTKDCFSAPGLQYALLPEEEEEEPQQQTSASSMRQESDKNKKKKEKKIKKRKRERKESESDSSSSRSSSECKSKRQRHDREDKKKKKHKKHKSHKHS